MTIQIDSNFKAIDLGLLAIEAAEELERHRRGLPTNFTSVNKLSELLSESFVKRIEEQTFDLRLDHASVFSNALSNSIGSKVNKKTISEIANEAIEIASRLNQTMKSKDDELKLLISFCIALSDSAALYREELEELKKHLAA